MSKKNIEKYLPMIEDFSFEHKNRIYTDKFKSVWETHNSENFIKQYFNELPELNDLDRLLYTDLNTYLPDDLMVKTDIASMAVSLECRAPFLDHKFVEYVSGIPSDLKLKNKTTKFILKDCFKDYIPHNLVNRPKAGFAIPISEWFRTDLKSYIKNILSDRFFERGLFDKKQILNMLNEHLTKQNEHGYKLWNLMCLELWFRKFFD
jgi:asparagine synthase (glutamine-hydrolysing)